MKGYESEELLLITCELALQHVIQYFLGQSPAVELVCVTETMIEYLC